MQDEKKEGMPQSTGSYKVERIILMNSSFHREVKIYFSKPITLSFDHSSEAQETSESDGFFGVGLTFSFKGIQEADFLAFSAEVKMIGIFEKVGEPAVSEDLFKKINAPAIIYPFIREHLHGLCQKGSVGNVLLPTVNFKI